MKKNVRNKKYAIKEAVSYYILGYKRYEQNVNQNGLGDILKDIVEVWFLCIDDKHYGEG